MGYDRASGACGSPGLHRGRMAEYEIAGAVRQDCGAGGCVDLSEDGTSTMNKFL